MIPKFIKGLKSNLPVSGFTEGAYYQCEDTGELFFASNSSTLIKITKEEDDLYEDLVEKSEDLVESKQEKLVSGDNIKTINNKTIIGEGDFNLTEAQYEFLTSLTDVLSIELPENKMSPTYQIVTLNSAVGDIQLVPKENVTPGFLNKIMFKNTGTETYNLDYSTFDNLYKEGNISILPNKITEITWMLLKNGTYVIYESTDFNKIGPDPLENLYLKFTAQEDNAVISYITVGRPDHNFQYSYDGETWVDWSSVSAAGYSDYITLNTGQFIYVKGLYSTINKDINNYMYFSASKRTNITGNVQGLLWQGIESLTVKRYTFRGIFGGFPTETCPKMPAVNLGIECYEGMFSGCTLLKEVPELPSTTLSMNCYSHMFAGCTSLTEVPEDLLPATKLGDYPEECASCYEGMFSDCTSLTKTPKLPATILSNACYDEMFARCTSLTKIPDLPAIELTQGCYRRMFVGCTGITTKPVLPATTLAASCYMEMFMYCTGLTSAPVLSVTNLEGSCYTGMFEGCTNLTVAPELPATDVTVSCYERMFKDCTNLSGVPVLSATTLMASCYKEMFSGCENITTAPALPATTLADLCYYQMFYNCSRLNSASELPAEILKYQCYYGMFYGCTSLIKAPDLLAPALVDECYKSMFYGCSSLNYIKCNATENVSTFNTNKWVQNVAPSGDFYYAEEAESYWIEDNVSSIPIGWTKHPIIKNPEYITFYPLSSSGRISFEVSGNPVGYNFEYSKDKINWTPWEVSQNITMSSPLDKVYIRGNNPNGISRSDTSTVRFWAKDNSIGVIGNIMTLIDGTGTTSEIPNDYCFAYMFYNGSGYLTIEDVKLPATTLKPYCYYGMFEECYLFTKLPELPAKTLKTGCYKRMFANNNYRDSFAKNAVLPATVLVEECYQSMFKNCKRLSSIKCYATDISANKCTAGWVFGIDEYYGDFYYASGTLEAWTRKVVGDDGFPYNWRRNEIPE